MIKAKIFILFFTIMLVSSVVHAEFPFNDDLHIQKGCIVDEGLQVVGATTVTGGLGVNSLTVSGTLTTATLSVTTISSNTSMSGSLTVAGTTTLNGVVGINAATNIVGNTAITGTATVTGNADISGKASIGGNTIVTGDVTVNGKNTVNSHQIVKSSLGVGTLTPTVSCDVVGQMSCDTLRLATRATSPDVTVTGAGLYYDKTNNKLCFYTGSEWKQVTLQ